MTQEDSKTQERRERKSLLKKYDIPLNHLEFDYIKDLKNVKELEKIYKILKSSELGYFPELTECAENRLKDLSPNSRILRKAAPPLSKDYLDSIERDLYFKDLKHWKADMESKEINLKNCTKPNRVIPPIRRNSGKINDKKEQTTESKEERIKSCDYKSWDNYDADKECLKIELEEEKRLQEREMLERTEREKEKARKNMNLEETAIEDMIEQVCRMTPEEREMLAIAEKDIGNEFYKTHHLDEAVKHYTRSIYLCPMVANHNNRAAVYLMQCKFTKALADLNVTITMDPNNVKARFRRAATYQHKNEFQKALEDIRVVLAKEPNNVLARHLADRLREDCNSLPKKYRLKVRDGEGETHVEEVTEEEMLNNYKDKEFIEINDFGLPKIMCNCNGKYVNEPGIRHEDNMRYQHIMQRKQGQQQCSHRGTSSIVAQHSVTKQAVVPINDPELKPSAATTGRRRLEILELDSIVEDSEESLTTNCIVKDMRTAKDAKTDANINIAQTVSSSFHTGKANELDKSKRLEFKTAWNQNVKKSVDAENEIEKEFANMQEKNVNRVLNQIDQKQELKDRYQHHYTLLAQENRMEVMQEDAVMCDTNVAEADVSEVKEVVGDSVLHEVGNKGIYVNQWLSNTDSSVNKEFEKCMDLSKCHGAYIGELPSLENCYCTLNKELLKPQNFLEKWNSASKNLSDEQSKFHIFKGVCPLHIPEVFSLNLSDVILTDIINCLCRLFEETNIKENILHHVRAVLKLERFNIIIFFVAPEVKIKLKNILSKMGPVAADVWKAFY